MRVIGASWPLLLALVVMSCTRPANLPYVPLAPLALPAISFEKPPQEPYDAASYAITPRQMTSFYDVPGEYGYIVNGRSYGFDDLSFIVTETHPHGGPPLHTHKTEEAHVVLSGTMEYVIGNQRFTVSAPYIARVPAGVSHTFANVGTTPLNVMAVFPTPELDWTPADRWRCPRLPRQRGLCRPRGGAKEGAPGPGRPGAAQHGCETRRCEQHRTAAVRAGASFGWWREGF